MVTVRQSKSASRVSDILSARVIPLLGNPWGSAVSTLWKLLEDSLSFLAMAALAGAVLAGAAKILLPPQYTANVQVLIDPRGVNLKSGDLFSQFDANAAINFVESQMVVLRSDRVLARAIDAVAPKLPAGATSPASKPVNAVISTATNQAETRAIAALQGALSV